MEYTFRPLQKLFTLSSASEMHFKGLTGAALSALGSSLLYIYMFVTPRHTFRGDALRYAKVHRMLPDGKYLLYRYHTQSTGFLSTFTSLSSRLPFSGSC